MGDPQSQGWTAIEDALLEGNRPYTVFVGHEHNYAKFVRHGRDYFMLATTGGGSKMRGVRVRRIRRSRLGDDEGRRSRSIANILLEGVQPNDVRTARDLPRFETNGRLDPADNEHGRHGEPQGATGRAGAGSDLSEFDLSESRCWPISSLKAVASSVSRLSNSCATRSS